MKISADNIYGWPGYRLLAGDVTLGLVPSIGGRIMSLTFKGEELFYVHEPLKGKSPDLGLSKKEFGFPVWGGDKTWVAPEWAWLEKSPPMALDSGAYSFEIKDGAAVMVSPVCPETGLQIVRRVSLDDQGVVLLQEEFLNAGSEEFAKGIWNVTQVLKPFDVYLPAELASVRSYHLEDPTLPDLVFSPQAEDGWVKIPCQGDVCYKFGAMLREGRAMIVRRTGKGDVAFTRSFAIDPGKPYAHRSMVEVFNSALYPYGEIEVHSPLYKIAPGGRVRFEQQWVLSEAKGQQTTGSRQHGK